MRATWPSRLRDILAGFQIVFEEDEFLLDAVGKVQLHAEFGGLDGAGDLGAFRGAVADDDVAVYAEEGAAGLPGAVREVVEALGEAFELGVGELAAELVLEEGGGGATEGLGELEEDVADEAIADDDVGLVGKDIGAFNVADEVEAAFLEDGEGFLDLAVALAVFAADAEEADGGIIDAEELADEDAAHNGEAHELLGTTVDVAADV